MSSSSPPPQPSSGEDSLRDAYFSDLRAALDAASLSFFAARPDLNAAAQASLVSDWTSAENRRPHRPAVADSIHAAPSLTRKIETHANGERKKVRAYIDGCYDLMHSGHYNAIRQAKSLCDELVLGLHSNAEIERAKGPPVMSDEERLEAAKACKWVDQVVFDTPYEPSVELLDKLQCDFAVHGDDDAVNSQGVDAFADVKAAGRLAIVKRTEGVSTTDLVNRLLKTTASEQAAATTEPLGPAGDSGVLGRPPVSSAPASSVLSPSHNCNDSHAHSSALSNFLPTTWRISQFANHRVPKKDDRVVYICGSFDLFHIGHIRKIEQAKKLGTFLYVGVFDDDAVTRWRGRPPLMNVHERVLNVLSCKYVDEVVIGAPVRVTRDLLRTLNVSVIARPPPSRLRGEAAATSDIDPFADVHSLVEIHDIKPASSLTTSMLIQRIIENRAKYEKRNAARAEKDEKYAANKTYVEEK